LILLGADQIDPKTGSVKNKIGSLALAKFAKGQVIVVTSTDKLGSLEEEMEEENDAGEVTGPWPVKLDGVRVRNVYFEWIEGDLIDFYITERGVLSHGELNQISAEREEMLKVWDILY
jgi:translation initiation factor 2B subunit (eIF-2B alpha/beta/delta family)